MKVLRSTFILTFVLGCMALAWVSVQKYRIEQAREQLLSMLEAPTRLAPIFQHPDVAELLALPTVTHWSYPMGSARGAMIYNAQPFGTTRHLGEDLNGIGGENSDLGDPIYAIAPGLVTFAAHAGEGWGNVIIVLHAVSPEALPTAAEPAAAAAPRRYVQSFYAHMEEIQVKPGEMVAQEQVIGTVGGASGRYLAHLHFELRELISPYIGAGYRDAPPMAWLPPEETLRTALASELDLLQARLNQRAAGAR